MRRWFSGWPVDILLLLADDGNWADSESQAEDENLADFAVFADNWCNLTIVSADITTGHPLPWLLLWL